MKCFNPWAYLEWVFRVQPTKSFRSCYKSLKIYGNTQKIKNPANPNSYPTHFILATSLLERKEHSCRPFANIHWNNSVDSFYFIL